MRNRILIFLIALAGGLLGANVQPILTGAGKLIFPEASPGASLSASSGKLTIAAGGTNKDIYLTPSGTGLVGIKTTSPQMDLEVNGSLRAMGFTAPSSGIGVELDYTAGNGYVLAFNRATATYVPLIIQGTPLYLNGNIGGNVGVGSLTANWPLDVTGDTNTSGVYRQGGTAGLSVTKTIRNSAGTGTCTMTFSGGILTASTC